jgi:hypothetical protein
VVLKEVRYCNSARPYGLITMLLSWFRIEGDAMLETLLAEFKGSRARPLTVETTDYSAEGGNRSVRNLSFTAIAKASRLFREYVYHDRVHRALGFLSKDTNMAMQTRRSQRLAFRRWQ